MVEIHLHADIRCTDFFSYRVRFGLRVQQIPRDVARVDGLDGERDVVAKSLARREAQVVHERRSGALAHRPIRAFGQHAGHHMHPRTTKLACKVQRGGDTRRELLFSSGQSTQAAFTARNVSRRRIDQHLGEVISRQARGDLRRRKLIGESEFHGAETVMRGCGVSGISSI